MNDGEYFRALHPDRRQIVDVEKTPVIDLVGRNPPKTQAVSLIVQKLLQRVEAVWISLAAVDDSQYFLQTGPDHIAVLDQGRHSAPDDFLLPLPLPHSGQVGVLARRKVRDCRDNALQFQHVTVGVGELSPSPSPEFFPASGAHERGARGK